MCFNRSNKIALTILSQLTITLANIIENFEKENNKITSQNVRILKIIFFFNFFLIKRSLLIVHFVHLNGLPIAALTLKISNKNNQCLLKMVKIKA